MLRDAHAEPTDVLARLAADEALERVAPAAPVDVRKEPVGKVEPDTELAQQIQHLLVVDGDELRACLGVPAVVERRGTSTRGRRRGREPRAP